MEDEMMFEEVTGTAEYSTTISYGPDLIRSIFMEKDFKW